MRFMMITFLSALYYSKTECLPILVRYDALFEMYGVCKYLTWNDLVFATLTLA